MTAEIVNFPNSINRRLDQIEQQEKRQQQQREHEIGNLNIILNISKTKPILKFKSETDYRIAARANGNLWMRVRDKGVRMKEIQKTFPKAHRYMMCDGGSSDPEQGPRRAKKLTGPVRQYLELAKTIALTGGMDPEEAMISVLRGTSLWTESPRKAEGIDERSQHLAQLLQEMVGRVIRQKSLAKLLDRARKIPGVWDVHRSCFNESDMAALFQSGYEGWYEHWTEAPPLPSVALIRLPLATVTTTVLVGREAVPDEAFSAYLAPEVDWIGNFWRSALEPLDHESDPLEATIAIQREIRLAIGPTTSGDDIGAMFEARILIRATIEHLGTELPLWPSCDLGIATRSGGSLVRIGEQWRRITLPRFWEDAGEAISDTFDLVATDPVRDPKGSEIEHWYISWTPVDAAHVSHWLDRPAFGSEAVPREEPCRRAPGTLWFSSNRLAFNIERDLHDGSLEAELGREVETIRAALDRRETEWRAAALASTAALIGELRGDIDGNQWKD